VSLLNIIASASLVMSIFCFLLFLYQVYLSMRPATAAAAGKLDDATRQGAGIDPSKIAEAFAKLADSLNKAGPLISFLVGSMFFMLTALASAQLGK
jgi:hypothetical protein